ncbi:hypothetical protein RA275_27920, partial [Pseudomonas syringae pv. tagetis]
CFCCCCLVFGVCGGWGGGVCGVWCGCGGVGGGGVWVGFGCVGGVLGVFWLGVGGGLVVGGGVVCVVVGGFCGVGVWVVGGGVLGVGVGLRVGGCLCWFRGVVGVWGCVVVLLDGVGWGGCCWGGFGFRIGG